MNDDLLARLSGTRDEIERAWLLTEALLNTLPAELASLVWAAAIPHWFNADILMALRPELNDRMETLYADLCQFAFVRPFVGRGHYIHESTRKQLLD